MVKRLVLEFAGAAASDAEIRRLVAERIEVVTVTLDFGTGPALEAIRDRALAAGASRAHVLEVRDEFAREYLLPCLRAGVLGGGRSSPRAVLRRALTRRKLRDIAALEGAEVSDRVVEPPALPAERKSVSSDRPALVDIAFAGGAPAAVNGIAMPLTELIGTVATIAGEQGLVSLAADAVLQAAHGELVKATLPRDLLDLCGMMRGRYVAALVADDWFAPIRIALDAFFAAAQGDATGAVQMKLFNGEGAAVRVTAQGPHDDSLVGPV